MKKIILSIMAFTALASCQKSEEQSPEVGASSEVTFTSVISTRATDTQWDLDDKIGLFMYVADEVDTYNGDSENVLYTTSGGSTATFTSTDPLLFPTDESVVDYIAYHPYKEDDYLNNVITLNTADQSSDAKVKAQDFMVASVQGCGEEDNPSLSFTRKMSKIVVTINRKASTESAVLSDISLTNVVVDGTFTICNDSTSRENGSVEAGSTTSNISLFESSSNQIEVIIVPQSALSSRLILTLDGELYALSLCGTFAENKHYSYTLTIGAGKAELSGATITDWVGNESENLTSSNETFTASGISSSSVPKSDIWIITDEGEITSELTSGVVAALKVAYNSGRYISIIMPNATSIGESAFYSATDKALVYIELPNVVSIGNYSFNEQNNLAIVKMPKVETIGAYAFRSCARLTTISDLSGVTSIGKYAFSSCSALTTDLKLNNITELPEYLFEGCANLKSVELSNVETIGTYAFLSCTNLTTISDLSEVTSIGECAFDSCSALATDIKLNNITELPVSAFYKCTSLKSVELANIETIGIYAFCSCTSLTTISDLSGVTSIGECAFEKCRALATDIKLNNITELPEYAFTSCTSLKSVELSNVETIGDHALANCTSLTEIELPKVTTIGNQVFAYSAALTTVKLTTESAITCGEYLFYDVETSNITLYISETNKSVVNFTDGTYTFGTIIYND